MKALHLRKYLKLIIFLISLIFVSSSFADDGLVTKVPVKSKDKPSVSRSLKPPEYQGFAAKPFIDRHHANFEPETKTQIYRIYADGGVVIDFHYMNRVIRKMKSQGIYSSCKFLADANFGVKKNTTTGAVSKLYDISGNNNDAVQTTADNQPIWTANVQNGRAALVFDGTNDILTIPDSSEFTLSSNGLYMSSWMSFSSLAVDFHGLFSHYLNAGHRWQFYYEKTNGMMFYVNDGVNNGIVISQASVVGYSINTFYHLAITRNVNDWDLYRNATSVKSDTNTFDIQDINASLTLGNLVDGAGTYLTGKVGGWVFFTTTLTTAQRQALESLINTYYAIY